MAALDAIPGWTWDQFEAEFQRGMSALRSFVAREGHARVLKLHVENVEGDDFNLGTWIVSRRSQFRRDKLSADRIAALDAIPGWTWESRRR